MKHMLWMAVAGVLLFSGCTPDNEFECPEPYTGALTADEEKYAGIWQLTALKGDFAVDLTDDETDNASTDYFSQLNECAQQARYVFADDRKMGYYASNFVEEVCEEELYFSGTWKATEGVVNVVAGCATANFNLKLDEGASSFSYTTYEQVTNFQGDGIPTQVTYTFTKVVE